MARNAAFVITGLDGGYDWSNYGLTWTQLSLGITSGGITATVRSDGKVLLCGVVNGLVYSGTVPDVESLLNGVSPSDWASTGIPAVGSGRCKLFWADGYLWLSVSQSGSYAAGIGASYKLYRSASGKGDDFTLFKTIASAAASQDYFINTTEANAGSILVLPNGRYVLCGPNWQRAFTTYIAQKPAIWTSDDKGTTWTMRYEGAYGAGGGFYMSGAPSSEVVRMPSGKLFWGYGVDYGNAGYIPVMSDDGTTWIGAPFDMMNTKYVDGSFHVDSEGNLIFCVSGYTGSGYPAVYQIDSPETAGVIRQIAVSPNWITNAWDSQLIQLGNRFIVTAGDRFTLGSIKKRGNRIRNVKVI